MTEAKPLLFDRDGLKKLGIDIPWSRDVKAWVAEKPGRAQFFVMYLANGVINGIAGDLDDIKRQIADLKEPEH